MSLNDTVIYILWLYDVDSLKSPIYTFLIDFNRPLPSWVQFCLKFVKIFYYCNHSSPQDVSRQKTAAILVVATSQSPTSASSHVIICRTSIALVTWPLLVTWPSLVTWCDPSITDFLLLQSYFSFLFDFSNHHSEQYLPYQNNFP